jgi:LuxR family maltose regulon positive regulatory protein
MSVELLDTKLFRPLPHPKLVLRPRLIRQLDEGLNCNLTMVSAPPGYGKTSSVSAWIAKQSYPCAWLSLDDADNDPIRFWMYIIEAVRTIYNNLGESVLVELCSPQPPVIESILSPLIREIGKINNKFILVLDDYHIIESQSIHKALTYLIERQPKQLHIVIISREDPPLLLSRLRVRKLMAEIREKDLRFGVEEAADFFLQTMGLELAPDDVSEITNRTEGWIAGLQLAAISMHGHPDIHRFLQSLTGRHRLIVDYLTDEVLRIQPEEIRLFLLKTSILERLCGPLCDTITGKDDGQDILEHLERANLFIVSLDDERHWYRFHHLFRDLLQYHLNRRVNTDELGVLHLRACRWLAENDLKVEAIQHAIAGKDFELAADLIGSIAEALFLQGAVITIQKLIQSLPESILYKRPFLCVAYAWALNLTEQDDALETYLECAERMLANEPFENNLTSVDLRGHIASMRASKARRQQDIPGMLRYSQEALGLLSKDDLVVRAIVNMNLSLAYMLNVDLNSALQALSEVQTLGQKSGNIITTLNGVGYSTAVLIAQGKLRRAAGLCRQTIKNHLDEYSPPLPTLGHVYGNLARILYEWNDLTAAMAYLEPGILLGEQTQFPTSFRFRANFLNWIRQVRGEREDLAVLSPTISAIIDRDQADFINADFTAWRVRYWLAQGNREAAEEWATTYQEGRMMHAPWRPYGDLALARVMVARQQEREGLKILAPICSEARQVGGIGWLIEALILNALAFQALDETDQAISSLAEALSLAEPEGYIRSFVDEGESMKRLLCQAMQKHIHPEYITQLLNAFLPPLTKSTIKDSDRMVLQLFEPLSDREVEILVLISDGLSNREIAQQLYLSLSTVKVHTHNIYGKLGVNSRTQAITRARALGILPIT